MTEEKSDDVREGFGCILVVLAIFLAVVLWNITPELITYIEERLK